ncbi:MAG: glycosyltransferase [Bacteroidaceae bacterium]|nr:glycosyltransferase [Bacteroidaceae bacterium]
MKLSILICTIDEGIIRVPDVLMSPRDDVNYVVSMQFTKEAMKELVPVILKEREDVTLTFLEGKGLSRNRNNALSHATGDVLLIADDDNRYTDELIGHIFEAYEAHPEADVIHFQALDLEGNPLHPYPAPYVSSVELTFKRSVTTRFDERFGLGSEHLCAGEEEVWMKDASDAGYQIRYVNQPIVMTPKGTTGTQFAGNPQLQMSKGATFKHVYGTANALWRTLKEAGWWMVHRKENPFPILYNMLKGMVEV